MGESRQPLDFCEALPRWSSSSYCHRKHQQQRLDDGKFLNAAIALPRVVWSALFSFKIEAVPSVESSLGFQIGSRRPEDRWELVPHQQAIRMLARIRRYRGSQNSDG